MVEPAHAPLLPSPRRILLVTPSSPYPPDSGGAQRTALLYAALSKHAAVDLFLLGSAAADVQAVLTDRFRLVGTFQNRRVASRLLRRAIALVSPELSAILPDKDKAAAVSALLLRNEYDALVIRYSATACALRDLPKRHPKTIIIVDVDDLVAGLSAAGAAPGLRPRKAIRRRVGGAAARRCVESRERRSLLRCDGLWLNGPAPAWLADGDRPRIVRLPNIPFNRAVSDAATAEAGVRSVDVIAVAQFRYPPNEEGFDWFFRRVWPRIAALRPGASIRLVGLPPKRRTLRRWSRIPGVEIMGVADDLQPLYRASKIAVAPIHRGAGTKIKVLEALAMGLPCVCSPHAAVGLSPAEALIVGDGEAAFAKGCLDLLENDERRRELGSRGRASIDRHFSLASFDARVEELLTCVLDLPPAEAETGFSA
jgi:glycosyltransferase involved in cell wall biosynthesis